MRSDMGTNDNWYDREDSMVREEEKKNTSELRILDGRPPNSFTRIQAKGPVNIYENTRPGKE